MTDRTSADELELVKRTNSADDDSETSRHMHSGDEEPESDSKPSGDSLDKAQAKTSDIPDEDDEDENEEGSDDDSEEEDTDESNSRDSRPARQSAWQSFTSIYMTADPRSLGLFRIALGILLFVDIARRWPDIEAHYSNTGWLTNHFMLFRPMSSHLFSLYLAFSTPLEVKVLMSLHLLVLFLFIIGYRTRLMHVFAVILLVSINSRNISLENGGWVVLTLLTVWSMFLPLGRRFSVDAIRASLRARRESTAVALNDSTDPVRDTTPVVSLAVLALILQWTIIYYFNAVHKNGPLWQDGSAVYYFFHQDRMVTAFGGWVRDFIPTGVYRAMTWSTLVIEYGIALLLIIPIKPHIARMVAWALVCSLHLSIDAVVQLGPFSWAMVVMFVALIPTEAWEKLRPKFLVSRPVRELAFDPESQLSITICRIVKRLDVLGKVRFVPAPLATTESETSEEVASAGSADSNDDEVDETNEDESTDRPGVVAPSHAAPALRPLTVRDPETNEIFVGTDAILVLSDALVFKSLPFLWVRLPGVRGLIERRMERAAKHGAELDEYLELSAKRALPEYPNPEAPAKLALRRGCVYLSEAVLVIVMIACASQVLIENRAIPAWAKIKDRPEWMTAIVVYPRLFQGWSMFAPGPPTDDGRIVVDGVTKDGRRFDPLTQSEPDYAVDWKGGFHMNQIWGDFHRRIPEDRFRTYWGGVRDFIANHHQITGRPENELVSFDVWYISEIIPPPGQPPVKPDKRKLFSHTVNQ